MLASQCFIDDWACYTLGVTWDHCALLNLEGLSLPEPNVVHSPCVRSGAGAVGPAWRSRLSLVSEYRSQYSMPWGRQGQRSVAFLSLQKPSSGSYLYHDRCPSKSFLGSYQSYDLSGEQAGSTCQVPSVRHQEPH